MLKKNIFVSWFLIIVIFVIFTGCDSKSKKISLSDNDTKKANEATNNIYVYVVGEVKNPGVVKVKDGARLFDVIEQAGGMTNNAQKDYLNLADKVTDGQKVEVLSKKQYKRLSKKKKQEVKETATESQGSTSDLININTATAEELKTLSGIGDSKANAIIEYREEKGNFNKIEDIKNVSGIGDATFNNIKSQICVD